MSVESKVEGKGLYQDLLDVDKFIRVNHLQEVTNPIYLSKNAPTPDGVLSYTIFGTSSQDRKTKMAYIDLHGHYMHPLAAVKLNSYDRRLNKILFSQAKYTLTKDGDLIEDDDNGKTGPEFLYSIWGKVKVKDKDTLTTKEIQKFYEMDRNKLFLTKYPVIPAYYRDLNTQTASDSKSSSEINSMYSSLIGYTQSMMQYTDTFTNMVNITQARVQTILVNIYKLLMIQTVKGSPSKFGMLRRSLQGKNINYSARLVISAPKLRKGSFNDVQVKLGYATVPLAYTSSCFFPFMIYGLKRFFDSEFLQGGKYPVLNKDSKVEYVTITDTFDETTITDMITRFINSPASRFDVIETPPDTNGVRHKMVLSGRFHKDNTTFVRPMTLTDALYITAVEVTKDKHIFVSRYPLDNYNGQFPAKIEVSSTVSTAPVIIGEKFYQFYPICEGDPANSFIDTLQFSNTYLDQLGGD